MRPIRPFTILLALPLVILVVIGGVTSHGWRSRAPGPPFIVHATSSEPVDQWSPAFSDSARSALAEGRYDDLETMAAGFRAPMSRFVGGVAKLPIFYSALATVDQDCPETPMATPEAALDATRTPLQAWHVARPESITADVALAQLWLDAAWKARGCGYANSVTTDRWARMKERLDAAEAALSDADPDVDPHVRYLEIDIGELRSDPRSRLDALYRQAIARFPTYFGYYSQHARFLQEKWLGAPGELAGYLDGLCRPEAGPDGQVAYAFAAFQMMKENWRDDLFGTIGLDFPSVIRAYQVREARYGLRDKDWNAIFYVSLAGFDFRNAHSAIEQTGDRWTTELWRSQKSFDADVAWYHAHSAF